jgi:hypothetical protein
MLSSHQKKILIPDVNSIRGAPMGRHNLYPLDDRLPIKMRLVKVPFVDGDYDQGGAYWGGGNIPLWIAWGYDTYGNLVRVFVRGVDRPAAKLAVIEEINKAKFYK